MDERFEKDGEAGTERGRSPRIARVLPRPEIWPDGIDELKGFEDSVTEQGNVKTGSPSGVHDDCVMALALAAWQFSKRPPNPDGIRKIGEALTRDFAAKPRFVFPRW